MKYKFLGDTGLRVSELCLGTMTFGEDWKGGGTTESNSKAIFDAFVNAGGNFIDTANIYTNGTSETLVGKFMGKERHKFVLGTKYSITTNPKDVNASGNHRKNLKHSVEQSLKRLKTDYIDLFWVHLWDGVTPIAETMRALEDLVREGKVLYLGASDMPAWVVSQGNTMADCMGWTKFSAIQIEYNLLERTPEADLIPMAQSHQLSVLNWSPLRMGVLTGKYLDDKRSKEYRLNQPTFTPELQKIYTNEKGNDVVRKVVEIAESIDRTPAQVALNWLLRKNTLNIPLIGAKNLEHIQDNLKTLEFELEIKQMEALDKVSDITLGFPHSFLRLKSTQEMLLFPDYQKKMIRLEANRNLVQQPLDF